MRIDKNHWLFNKPIAHRGLWGNNVIENSLSAYQKAIDNGYPIEIDLFSTLDGEIVSFHDINLNRMTGVNEFIYKKTLKQLKELSLLDSEEKIPTLHEVLSLVNGKVPLLIELKNQPHKTFIEKIVNILKKYKGAFAIQSFNPLYLLKVKKRAPEFLRGVLASNIPDTNKTIEKFIVKRMPLNFLVKPDFISYDYKGLPLKGNKLPVISWTVTDNLTHNKIKPYCENIIFENFIPE